MVILTLMSIAATAWAAPEGPPDGELTRDHVRLEFHGTPQRFAKALAMVAESARRTYSGEFALDMPDLLIVSIDVRQTNRVAIWNDGAAHVTLTLRREAQLRAPSRSKVFNIYGLCYEMAELALRRTLGEPDWLSDAAGRGWSHYCASEAISRLFLQYGSSLWPDRYAYDAEGMTRLKRQVKDRHPTEVIQAAGLWFELARILGGEALGATLKAWRDVDVAPGQPAAALRKALPPARDAYFQKKLDSWFEEFERLVLARRSGESGRRTSRTTRLSRNPVLLKYDDGTSDGKSCLPEDGHIVYFTTPPDEWYITTLHLYGERFGVPLRKMEYATITLCDKALNPITSWQKPYGFFRGSRPRWFHLRLPPTRVPEEFAVVVQFFCREDKGVRVHRDNASVGHSAVGQPGGKARPSDQGDWMIRVELDTAKTSNPLIWQP